MPSDENPVVFLTRADGENQWLFFTFEIVMIVIDVINRKDIYEKKETYNFQGFAGKHR